ncbi:4-hydroxy-3-methylbut-2-en-1-yl diphosphate synthase [Neisseria gonorrhoeae]|uniref:4-hydroxy-3-methylbut-2-en-1-yl diphosphate synthase n=1 Tax=Neisseria gonorrhoeae TaxID=485 RepID=A0A378VXL4_NEIGO|nr:4-hydroxy-3-methylbut-2-en-1-yl diphosphate synthase [Neisseria gonorrhoeae]
MDQSLAKRMMDANLVSSAPKPPEEVMKEALIVSALESAEKAVLLGLPEDKSSCRAKSARFMI